MVGNDQSVTVTGDCDGSVNHELSLWESTGDSCGELPATGPYVLASFTLGSKENEDIEVCLEPASEVIHELPSFRASISSAAND